MVNVLHLELLERVTMSKCLMGNLFDKVGYDGLTFLKKTIDRVNESYRYRVNVVGYGKYNVKGLTSLTN